MRTFGSELILDALDVSLDSRKVGFAMAGLVITAAVAGLLAYVSEVVDSHVLAIVLLVLAGVAAWVLSSLVYGTVAKMSYDDLSRRPSAGWYAALGYAARHLPTLLLSPVVLLIGIALIVAVEGAVLLAGRVPYFGELWAALLFLPLVVLNLFLILLSYLGVWLVPAVVAGEGGGIFRTLGHVRRAVRRAPGRILAYLSIALILGVLAALVIVPLVCTAMLGTAALTGQAVGEEKMGELTTILPDILFDYLPDQLEDLLQLGHRSAFGGSQVTYTIAAAILGLAILLIPAAILATLLVVFPVSCACASYLSVRPEQPEWAEPPVAPAEPPRRTCPNCGAEVSAQARFCLRCGHPQQPG